MSDDNLPAPDRSAELADSALDWLNSTFARTIALKLTPVLLPLIGIAAVWLQDVIGVNMDPAVATGFVVAVVIGAAATVVMFVRNHGQGAALIGTAALELEKLYEAGRTELSRPPAEHGTTLLSDPGTPLGTTRETP